MSVTDSMPVNCIEGMEIPSGMRVYMGADARYGERWLQFQLFPSGSRVTVKSQAEIAMIRNICNKALEPVEEPKNGS